MIEKLSTTDVQVPWENRSVRPVATPLAEKTGNEAVQTSEAVLALNSAGSTMAPGPDCQPLLVGGNTPSRREREPETMVEMDFHPKPLKERIVTLERRGRGIQATETFTDEEGWILASAGPTGVTIAANGFKTREDAAQNLRALADALDGGQKRRHRKAKEE